MENSQSPEQQPEVDKPELRQLPEGCLEVTRQVISDGSDLFSSGNTPLNSQSSVATSQPEQSQVFVVTYPAQTSSNVSPGSPHEMIRQELEDQMLCYLTADDF